VILLSGKQSKQKVVPATLVTSNTAVIFIEANRLEQHRLCAKRSLFYIHGQAKLGEVVVKRRVSAISLLNAILTPIDNQTTFLQGRIKPLEDLDMIQSKAQTKISVSVWSIETRDEC
jgi:hypothetical protein